jgi:TolA-binding protein
LSLVAISLTASLLFGVLLTQTASSSAPAEREIVCTGPLPFSREQLGEALLATAPIPTAPVQGAAPAVAPSPVPAPPPASPVAVPAPPAAARASVSFLYKKPRRPLKRGDAAAGRQRLEAVVRTFPRDAMADSARFELALLAHENGDQREALAQIRDILGHGTSGPFVEPARFLRCRVYLKEDRDAAETCLARFVRAFPRSAHDEVAVRALIDLSRARGQCSKAAQLAETYLQRHPKGPFAAEAARVRPQCGP